MTAADQLAGITPTAGAQLTQPAPNQSGVVLANLSTFVLTVTIGPDSFFHAPQVAQFYDTSATPGAPVTVTPTALPGDVNTAGFVAATWYGPDDDAPDEGAYPSSLPALASAIAQYVGPTAQQIGAAVGQSVPSAGAIGSAVGTAVPVPPSAAAIGSAVGGAVPVPPSAGAIGSAVGASVPTPPSATAIGGQVASQSNAMGIPNVGKLSTLFMGAVAANTVKGPYSVAAYNSLVVSCPSAPFIVQLLDANGTSVYNESFNSGTPVTIACETATSVTVLVGTGGSTLTVSGSNFAPTARTDARFGYTGVSSGTTATSPMVAGTTYPITFNGTLQGQVFAHFYINNSTAKGYWVTVDANGNQIRLADSAELVLDSDGHYAVRKMVALPAGAAVSFRCSTGGASTAGFQAVECAL